MNQGDASSFRLDPRDGDDAIAAAFDRMGRRMAGLAAAVDGFAARQEELHGRDYRPDLENIHGMQDRVRKAIEILNQRPGIQMTVEGIAADVLKVGRTARAADHDALGQAQQHLSSTTQKLAAIVSGRIDLNKQCIWLAAGAAAVFVCGAVLGDVLLPSIDRAMPASWLWPEQRAAGDLAMPGAEAGWRLLQVYAPAAANRLLQADRLVQANAAAIAACRERAASRKTSVNCSILVSGAAD